MSTTYSDRIAGVETSTAVKAPVRVATTANITLSGTQTIDGVAVAAEDRVLVKDQTNPIENGIYNVSTGAWARARDFNGVRDIAQGTQVYVSEGSTNSGLLFAITTSSPVVGSAVAFSAISSLGLSVGVNVQAFSATLSSIAALGTAAGKALYTTAVDVWAEMDVTAAGRSILGADDAAAQRTALGLGGLATVNILDEDDFASDDDTRPPSQQSTEARIDTKIADAGWQYAAEQVTTSGTEFDFAGVPAGVNEVNVIFSSVSLSGTDNILVQLENSGGLVTTGYNGGSQAIGASAVSSAAGHLVGLGNASREMTGVMVLYRQNGVWYSQHNVYDTANNRASVGNASNTLSGDLSSVRVTRSGTDTFDGGSVVVGWRI